LYNFIFFYQISEICIYIFLKVFKKYIIFIYLFLYKMSKLDYIFDKLSEINIKIKIKDWNELLPNTFDLSKIIDFLDELEDKISDKIYQIKLRFKK